MERKTLTGLSPEAYEHPWDAKALNALQAMPGLNLAVKALSECGIERFVRIQYTGSNLRVNADNFPEIYGRVTFARELLDVPIVPDIYIVADPSINALTVGIERPILVLSSGCIDLLTDDEQLFVIGHELGHMKSGHILYYQMAELLPVLSDSIPLVGSFISGALQLGLLNWQRMSEFTSDRAGLLACQDANVAISAMIKLAGLPAKFYGSINTEDFIAQARDFTDFDASPLDWIAKAVSIMGQSHPWTVMRANEFLKWIDAGDYDRVLMTDHNSPALLPASASFCSKCGGALTGTEVFCTHCGTRVPAPLTTVP